MEQKAEQKEQWGCEMEQKANHREQIYRKQGEVKWEQKADHREQIYRNHGEVKWSRRLTTESTSTHSK